MRCVNRNKQTFWYALYNATATEMDDYGNQIGTYTTYGNPIKANGNISAAKGEVVTRQFGDDDLYDRVIVLEDRDTPIDEYTRLWVDLTPELDANGALKVDSNGNAVTPHNYIVHRVGRGLPKFGSATIAISKVTVT